MIAWPGLDWRFVWHSGWDELVLNVYSKGLSRVFGLVFYLELDLLARISATVLAMIHCIQMFIFIRVVPRRMSIFGSPSGTRRTLEH